MSHSKTYLNMQLRREMFKGCKPPHLYDTHLKLLISPKNMQEAGQAIDGGAEIIDVKNPGEGSLGANYPWVIKQIRMSAPKTVEVSCTLGDAPNLPGSFSLASYGAASLGVDYVKIGLYGTKTVEEATFLLTQVVKSAKMVNPKIKVAAAGYADAEKVGALNPLLVPEVASKAGADVAMIDTAQKKAGNLFNLLTKAQLQSFIDLSHSYGLVAALAGSLRKQDLEAVYMLGADIAGLRGAACTGSDRNGGAITKELVAELVSTLKHVEAAHQRR